MTQIEWSTGVSDELSLRTPPLREAWEARGLGLLKGVADRIGAQHLPLNARVVPIMPSANGGGTIERVSSTVNIEAVLVNPLPQLPEVARLAWLLSQFKPLPNTPEDLTSLALVPPVLEAAADVELVCFDNVTLALALTHWNGVDTDHVVGVGETLMSWWNCRDTSVDAWTTQVAVLASKLETPCKAKGEACDFN